MMEENQIKKRFPRARWFDDGFEVSQAKYSGGAGLVLPAIQRKPWGLEVWLIYTDKYALKILYINAGQRFSLQKHEKKTESWLVRGGQPKIELEGKVIEAAPGQVVHIPAGAVHRVTAGNEDVELLEVSSPELWDRIRIEDDFERK